jgi:hypothetical protein
MQTLDIFMLDIGLTQPQLNDKETYIGGSNAKDIADGNWLKVYNQIALGESEDLSRIFKVQLGHITEEFNLTWFAHENDWMLPANRDTVAIRNKDYPYIGCLPDCIMHKDGGQEAVIDAKHTAAEAPWWDKKKVAEYYFPQAQHNMIACGIHEFWLSVIFGNEGPVPIQIEYDEMWARKYIGLCNAFWGHIERKEPPEAGEKLKVPEIKLDDMRELDMTTTNMAGEWKTVAIKFLTYRDGAVLFEEAKKILKSLVPEDVKKATGNGIVITRDKRGLFVKEAK